ncbi:1-testosterone hydratease/dehydrogenase (AtcB) [Steroidobacter denitrificans]|uniref:1-testosterone hydratease/dehydrogenase (AtcB) n=1 Tax=Steroidobacter denitrificans TaxID=465721 RepID=A0A127F985_STEDE|nr:xanthine dehydrogenase family protein subunit M [Steroidobacter denitrificans]AMN46160.1 1-testosterone hydratease/dehydrogenase (AtcB) [Steroidobacter denitrificans]
MKSVAFDYLTPSTLGEAVALLERLENEGKDTKILAGGQSLMPMLAMRVARPEILIDLKDIAELRGLREEKGWIVIGAMTSKREAEDSDLIRTRQPLFHAATQLVAHLTIRNRGSVGGSFAHGDPASEYPAVALVLDMEMKAVGPTGERIIPAADFFVTYMTTSLESNEILTEVRMPIMPAGTGWAIQEFARRRGDLALAGVAVTLRLQNGVCQDTRMAAFGVNPATVRLSAGEAALNGHPPDPATLARAAAAAAAALEEPMTCAHASSEYRRDLIKTLAERCLAQAVERAGRRAA